MHHLFRLRHLLLLAVVLTVGLVPLYANQQNLGDAASFAVLADDLDTTTGILDVNAPVNGGDGNVGANTYTPDATNITADGSVEAAGSAAVTNGLAAAAATAAALSAQASAGADPTPMGNGVLDGLVLTPGDYRIPAAASLSGGTTLTLNGDGVYIIRTDSTLSFGAAAIVNLVGGAQPANVFWVASSITAANASVYGTILASGDVTLDGTLIFGKLLAVNGADIDVVNNPATVNDFGVAPELTVGAPSGVA
ncbi:MAG: ice-binding family protein, partial [Actinomycetota bacterium]